MSGVKERYDIHCNQLTNERLEKIQGLISTGIFELVDMSKVGKGS